MSATTATAKVALVTGAAGAIGSATARTLAASGMDVCLVDQSTPHAIATEIETQGRRALSIEADVSQRDACQSMVSRTLDTLGRLDVLVNVAGVSSFGAAATLEEAEWDRVIAINLKGVFLSCQAAIAPMKTQKSGRIVNIGSVLAKNGGNPRPWMAPEEQERAGNVAYGAAKAGVHAMTLYLAKELAAHGVTVNCVAPGPIATAMTTELPKALIAQIPVGRMGTPEEVAAAVAYLAGDDAGFVTGEILDLNGGLWVD